MPALNTAEIVRAIEDAFTDSTASALLVSHAQGHPKRFYVTAGESSFPVWIYIWTLTHGGGAARPTATDCELVINPLDRRWAVTKVISTGAPSVELMRVT